MKEAPHDIQMRQQAKSSQMSASINKGKKKIQDAKLIEDLKMEKKTKLQQEKKRRSTVRRWRGLLPFRSACGSAVGCS